MKHTYIIILLTLISCSQKEYKSTAEIFEDLPKYEIKRTNANPLVLRGVGNFLMYDSVVVVKNYLTKSLTSVYDRKTGKIIAQTYPGEGPMEYIFISNIEKTTDSTYSARTANGKNYIALYNINDIKPDAPYFPRKEIRFGKDYKLKWDVVGLTSVLTVDSLIMGRSDSNDYMYSIVNLKDTTCSFAYEYPDDDKVTVIKSGKYQGAVAFNATRDKMFSVIFLADMIHFIRRDGMEMTMTKKYEYDPVIANTVNGITVYNRKTVCYYEDIGWNDSLVYVLTHSGKTFSETRKIESEEYERLCNEGYEKIYKKLLVFNEDGEPQYSIYLDTNPRLIDFNKGKLYVIHYNVNGDDELVEYDLSKKTLM